MTTTSLFANADKLEPIFGWLEEAEHSVVVEIWGLERGRRAALLAYCSGGDDEFGWSNWADQAREDPSELVDLFDAVELSLDDITAARLKAAFPDSLDSAPPASGQT